MPDTKAIPDWRKMTLLAGLLLAACSGPDPAGPARATPSHPPTDYRELEFGADGLWHRRGDPEPFTGTATRTHPNGKTDWETKIEAGRPVGRVREWDAQGNPIWPGIVE